MERESRRKQLEEKRKRLQELRQLKEARRRSKQEEQTTAPHAQPASSTSQSQAAPKEKQDPTPKRGDPSLDNIIDQLLQAPVPGKAEEEAKDAESPEPPSSAKAIPRAVSKPAKELKLVRSIAPVSLSSPAPETYTKEIQTDAVDETPTAESKPGPITPKTRSQETKGADVVQEEEEMQVEEKPVELCPVVDEAERQCIEESEEFEQFLRESVRLTERVVHQNRCFDAGVDFTGSNSTGGKASRELMSLKQSFFDDRYSKDRTVNHLDWSPNHKELFLVAHNKRMSCTSETDDWSLSVDPDGVVLLWSINMPERPEYVFTCQSEVHSAVFYPFNPSLVAGGTYSGEIVLWDLRAKATPVQHSMLSSAGHTHPVYSMSFIGSANAHSLASLSTDGKLCLWSMNNLATPTESNILQHGNREIAGTALAFPKGESNEYAIGTEEGAVFRGQIHGTNAGISSSHSGHYGPVTALDFNKAGTSSSDLLLTCSMDFTVKLWSHRHSPAPLHTFESSSEYIYDVKWSPKRPGLFATCDGTGATELWNLTDDLEVPAAQFKPSVDVASSRVSFSSDGQHLLIGDAAGKINLVEISPEIALPDSTTAERFESVIADLVDLAQE